MSIDHLIRVTANPDVAQRRFDSLSADRLFNEQFQTLDESVQAGVLKILGYSDFLSNYIRRYPACLGSIHQGYTTPGRLTSESGLRQYKYAELFKLTVQDLNYSCAYGEILHRTSQLADMIISGACELTNRIKPVLHDTCVLALGKLGASELNYSSDIDLIFVCHEFLAEEKSHVEDRVQFIQRLTRLLEASTGDGFLYRVDLKLRPWGRSGPLLLDVDDTENYYSASKEAWERFIWLRARAVAGERTIADDLLKRLEPFVFRKTLSDDDLRRFLEIKAEMQLHHRKDRNWNVKQGQGGIRDIEFFIQLMQIVNANSQPMLKATNTLQLLAALTRAGFLSSQDAEQIRDSYLFLRRLENHLQMVDEQQTHQLPDEPNKRLNIARSMIKPDQVDDAIELFEEQLSHHRAVAKNCFDRILPDTRLQQ